MVVNASRTDCPQQNLTPTIDLNALVAALTGKNTDGRPMSDDYDHLDDVKDGKPNLGDTPEPDPRPKDVRVGAINPYALVEAMIGNKLDRRSIETARIISDVLQTDYDELFDMSHESVLFAGLKLNERNRQAEDLDEKDMRILCERDLVTPDLSQVRRLDDIEKIGGKNMNDLRIKVAHMRNGKIRLIVDAKSLSQSVSNRNVTMSINELALPYRRMKGNWSPPNSSWEDMRDVFRDAMERRLLGDHDHRIGQLRREHEQRGFENRRGNENNGENIFEDPVQGASSNSWLIAAIFSVFWADPQAINRSARLNRRRNQDRDERDRQDGQERVLSVKFHDKGGRNNNSTDTVEVNYEVPVNNSTDEPVYCRSSDEREIWPSLYEKAFAKWIGGDSSNGSSRNSSQRPDLTRTHHGDPIKAMAQINGREPRYFFTDKHAGHALVGLVRASCVNFRCIEPMAAYTHATGEVYRGSNLVANHAYSVLGWFGRGEKQYVVLRNPFGVTEPAGLTSYPGLIDRVEPELWRPAPLLGREGVIALEARAFKEYFACIGVAN